jgi:threonylcarbamoyladenosine tRNA methylthiotransferase MtaB
VVLTGCASRLFPEDYGGDSRIETRSCGDRSISTPCDSSRSRGLLKIQDGCSNNCTYCIVPKARGASRSFSRESILVEAGRMAAAGMREIVLTGVDLASYGRDLGGSYGLADLAGDLLAKGGFRIRLGSVEPMGLDGGVLKRLAVPGMCRHIHFAFQSGSTAVLSRMGRPCTGEDVERLATEARRLFPGGIIGSDIMAGFPGETESDFEASLRLLEAGLLDYAHVFPYSPRPWTDSYARYGDASTGAGERARLLRAASESNRRRFELAQAGLELEALVEDRRMRNRHVALTDNYVALSAPPGSQPGEMIVMRPSPSEILNCRSDPEPE